MSGSRTRKLPVSKGINEITAEQLAHGNVMLQAGGQPLPGAAAGDGVQRSDRAAAAAGAAVPAVRLHHRGPPAASG